MDALLSLAIAGLFAAKWTIRIEAEWIGALERQRPELAGRMVIGATLCEMPYPTGRCPPVPGGRW